eukprot:1185221-Prorocentrum_minimum.AAC.1
MVAAEIGPLNALKCGAMSALALGGLGSVHSNGRGHKRMTLLATEFTALARVDGSACAVASSGPGVIASTCRTGCYIRGPFTLIRQRRVKNLGHPVPCLSNNNIASFYGSSCATYDKDALNTPETRDLFVFTPACCGTLAHDVLEDSSGGGYAKGVRGLANDHRLRSTATLGNPRSFRSRAEYLAWVWYPGLILGGANVKERALFCSGRGECEGEGGRSSAVGGVNVKERALFCSGRANVKEREGALLQWEG